MVLFLYLCFLLVLSICLPSVLVTTLLIATTPLAKIERRIPTVLDISEYGKSTAEVRKQETFRIFSTDIYKEYTTPTITAF